jgi:hypothetical protein
MPLTDKGRPIERLITPTCPWCQSFMGWVTQKGDYSEHEELCQACNEPVLIGSFLTLTVTAKKVR